MDEASQREAAQTRDLKQGTNESTFVRAMWDHMHKHHRDKRTSGAPGSDIDDGDWTTETWHKSYLGAMWNRLFRPGAIPRIEPMDQRTTKLLDSLPRVKDPKPDLTYGYEFTAFTEEELKVCITHLRFSQVSPDIYFPFFIAEFKSKSGNMMEAENQACRGGSAMVNAVRELQKVAGLEKTDAGADTQSFAFTLAMITTSANLFVHWAEIRPGKATIYHMHRIAVYSLEVETNYQDIRRDLNNVLDWCLSDRMQQIKHLLKAIDEMTVSPPHSVPAPPSVAAAPSDPAQSPKKFASSPKKHSMATRASGQGNTQAELSGRP